MAVSATAIVAAFGGTATGIAAIATVVSVTGMAVTVVGMATGNKELMKWGGIMSLAGGVVGLAGGAMSGGAAAGAGIDAAAGETVANAAGYGAETAFMGSEGASLTTGLSEAATTSGLAEANALTGGVPEVQAFAPPSTETGLLNSSMPASTTPQAATEPVTQTGQEVAAKAANMNAPPPPTAEPGGLGKWWGGLDKTTQSKYVDTLLQTGGKAIGGLFQGWSEEQKIEFEKEKYANYNSQPSFNQKPKLAGGLLNSNIAQTQRAA